MTSSNGSPSTRVDISLPVGRPKELGKWTPEFDAELRAREASNAQLRGSSAQAPNVLSTEFFPQGKRSLSGIAVRAFCLGNAFVLGLVMTVLLAYFESRFWRPWLFLSTLSIFHFLEFYTTAAYNTPKAWIASFLLTNGDQYRQAHTMAFIETCVTSYFFPSWQAKVHTPVVLALGIILVVVGQTVRSIAMAQAGTNFNHTVQSKKNDDHELVTTGLYTYFRHPSYFGFFWWGVGTQVMLGNTVCFLGYVGVLWYFFSRRISRKLAKQSLTGLTQPLRNNRRGEAFGRLLRERLQDIQGADACVDTVHLIVSQGIVVGYVV
jgi:protein-S-isoprenylcysteine O-methyltransferase